MINSTQAFVNIMKTGRCWGENNGKKIEEKRKITTALWSFEHYEIK